MATFDFRRKGLPVQVTTGTGAWKVTVEQGFEEPGGKEAGFCVVLWVGDWEGIPLHTTTDQSTAERIHHEIATSGQGRVNIPDIIKVTKNLHDFTLILHGDVIDYYLEEGLHEAGFEDALLGWREGEIFLDFTRAGPSLTDVVKQTQEQLEKAGFLILRGFEGRRTKEVE